MLQNTILHIYVWLVTLTTYLNEVTYKMVTFGWGGGGEDRWICNKHILSRSEDEGSK
jgi:hypothetical protein